jgi:tRNA nucleotidyltransferase/poly(A) polymerase/tetratricopeptide (TPR) repeat protein
MFGNKVSDTEFFVGGLLLSLLWLHYKDQGFIGQLKFMFFLMLGVLLVSRKTIRFRWNIVEGNTLLEGGKKQEELNNFDLAIALYEKADDCYYAAIKIDPSDDELFERRVVLVHRLGLLNYQQGRATENVESLQKAKICLASIAKHTQLDDSIKNVAADTCRKVVQELKKLTVPSTALATIDTTPAAAAATAVSTADPVSFLAPAPTAAPAQSSEVAAVAESSEPNVVVKKPKQVVSLNSRPCRSTGRSTKPKNRNRNTTTAERFAKYKQEEDARKQAATAEEVARVAAQKSQQDEDERKEQEREAKRVARAEEAARQAAARAQAEQERAQKEKAKADKAAEDARKLVAAITVLRVSGSSDQTRRDRPKPSFKNFAKCAVTAPSTIAVSAAAATMPQALIATPTSSPASSSTSSSVSGSPPPSPPTVPALPPSFVPGKDRMQQILVQAQTQAKAQAQQWANILAKGCPMENKIAAELEEKLLKVVNTKFENDRKRAEWQQQQVAMRAAAKTAPPATISVKSDSSKTAETPAKISRAATPARTPLSAATLETSTFAQHKTDFLEIIRQKIPRLPEVIERLQTAHYDVYITGGAIRNTLVEKDFNDVDLVVVSNLPLDQRDKQIPLTQLFEDCGTTVFSNFQHIQIDNNIDIASLTAYVPGSGDSKAGGNSLHEDVMGRPLTVDAIHYRLTDKALVHLPNALQHLAKREMHFISDNLEQRFKDTPMLMLVPVYRAGALAWDIPREVIQAISQSADLLQKDHPSVSVARLWGEVEKLLKLEPAARNRSLRLLSECGLLMPLLNKFSNGSASDIDCLRLLIAVKEAGVDVDLNGVDQNHETLLHRAAARGQLACMCLLLSMGANPNARSHTGNTPLHFAATSRNIEGVNLLCMMGADPSCANRNGRVPDLSWTLQFATTGNAIASDVVPAAVLSLGAVVAPRV